MRTTGSASVIAFATMIACGVCVGCSSSDDASGNSGPADSDLPDFFVFDTGHETRGEGGGSDGGADTFDSGGTSETGDAETCPAPRQICDGVCSDLTSDNKNCDGCGKACAAGSACIGSTCTACVPRTCKEIGATCGTISDRCGGTIDCGACSSIGVCNASNSCDCSVTCGPYCVDSKSDPRNCGTCGNVCASGNCTGGTCAPALPCKLPYVSGRSFKVLFYGPNGTAEEPFLPASSATADVTVWDEPTWRTKTTTDFKTFDLIVLGEGATGCPADPAGPTYDALVDTADQWAPAVGRIVVSELDAATRATAGIVAAQRFLTSTLQWLAIGPGTGLYVAPDCGTRHLDFLSYVDASFHSVAATGDSVVVVDTGHPTMLTSSDSTLSAWHSSYVGTIDGTPSGWEPVVVAGGSGINPLVVARNLSCPCAGLKLPTESLGSISGCAGSVAFADRDTLCGPSTSPCTAAQWMASRNAAVPTHNYWTDDALTFAGSGTSSCEVSTSTSVGGVTYSACGGGATPMRVCGANPDAEGNACNWLHCGYESATPDDYFGGCSGNTTAGTICCQ